MIAEARRWARRTGVLASTAIVSEGWNLAASALVYGTCPSVSGKLPGRNGAWLGCIVAHGKASIPRAVGMRAGMDTDAPAALRHPRQPLSGTNASNHGPLAAFPGGEPLAAGART